MQDNPIFGISSVIFIGRRLVALKRASLLVTRWGWRLADGQSYYKCLEWAPLTATAMYAVKHLVKFTTALLTCSCDRQKRLSTRPSS